MCTTTCEMQIVQDIDRGALILSIQTKSIENTVFFFKYEDQVIQRHPEQVRNLVRKCKPTKRVKKIDVDISDCLFVYYNSATSKFEFRGCELRSTAIQAKEVIDRKVNKEIGILKRKMTMEKRKEEKEATKEKNLQERIKEQENQFQIERARRITELTKERGVTRVVKFMAKETGGESSGCNQMGEKADDHSEMDFNDEDL